MNSSLLISSSRELHPKCLNHEQANNELYIFCQHFKCPLTPSIKYYKDNVTPLVLEKYNNNEGIDENINHVRMIFWHYYCLSLFENGETMICIHPAAYTSILQNMPDRERLQVKCQWNELYKTRVESLSKMRHSFNLDKYFDPALIGIISSRSSPTIFVQDCVLARSAMRIIPTASCTKRRYDLKDQFINSNDEAYDKVDNSKQENISLSLVTTSYAETVEHLVYSNVEPIPSQTSREDKNFTEDLPLGSVTNSIELEKQVLIQHESIISFDEETNKESEQYFVTDQETQTDGPSYSELNFYQYKIESLNEIFIEIIKEKIGFRFGNKQIDFKIEKTKEPDNDKQITPIEFIEKYKNMKDNTPQEPHTSGISYQINKEQYCLFKNNRSYKYYIIHRESGRTFSHKDKFEYCNNWIDTIKPDGGIKTFYSCKLHEGKCTYVSKGSQEKANIASHIESHFFILVCGVCNATIKWRTALSAHFKLH